MADAQKQLIGLSFQKLDFISIIIPAFNAERWLARTLDSVSAALDADCEVIIVNDGSADDTLEIVERYADADPRFVVVDIAHVGPCAARKAGFLESQGDYIMFVDSDDLLPDTAIADLRRLVRTWDSAEFQKGVDTTDEPPQMVIANTTERRGKDDHLLLSGSRRALTGMQYACDILERKIFGFLPGHLYSRRLLEAIDWDDSPIITHQDNFYLLLSMAMKLNQWAPEKKSILIAPSVVAYRYIRRSGSQSGLMALTPKGLERVMDHVYSLGLPEPQLTVWGLDVIKTAFVDRGIPFPNDYSVAARLRERALSFRDRLPDHLQDLVDALSSEKRRTQIATELARTAGWTFLSPHLSIVVVCGHNIKRVRRTVQSVFDMGFRNLEVVLVEMPDNTHAELVAINQISIQYPRVRIIKAQPGDDKWVAAGRGLDACEGLCVAFMRPGDMCSAQGLYDAVTRIDYGADVVMTNFCLYDTLTHLHGKVYSYARLRTTEESRNAEHTAANTTEDIYRTVYDILQNPDPDNPILISGLVWRTDFVKAKKLHDEKFNSYTKPDATFSYVFLNHLMHSPLRVVTQDKNTPPAFHFYDRWLLRKLKL